MINGLKEVDQSYKIRVELGFDIEAILSDKEKPLVQHLVEGGISYEVQLAWLKNLKEALSSVITENLGTIHFYFTMFAPVLAFNIETNSKIVFNDMDSLKNHPMATNFMVSFPQIIEMISGNSTEKISNLPFNDAYFATPEYVALKEENDWKKEEFEAFEMLVKLTELMKDMNSATNIAIKVVKQGHGALEIDITGKNVNKGLAFGLSVG